MNPATLFVLRECCDNPRQHLGGGSSQRASNSVAYRGCLRIDFGNEGRAIIVGRECCRRIDDRTRSDDQDDVGAGRGLLCFLPNISRQRFAKPDDVGTPAPAARVVDFVERKAGGAEWAACIAVGATRLAQTAVQLEYVARAGAQVERIHVLGGEREIVKRVLQLGDREVAGIGLGSLVRGPALVIPGPN
jgi:hypothetical protein